VEVAALDWSDRVTYRYPHSGSGSIPQGSPPTAQCGATTTTLEAPVSAEQEEKEELSAAHIHARWGGKGAGSMVQGGLCSPLLPLPLSHLHPNPYPHLQWDVVIGADVVWLEELVPLLIRALTALCGPDTLLLLAHQKRSERTDDLLFEGLSRDFEIEKV
jgi:Lysine methyltransferase